MVNPYTQKFVSHVESFMKEYCLFPENNGLVAVSGGMDSMALLWCLNQIIPNKIKALHLNHGTRPENQKEQELIESFCQQNNIKFLSKNVFLDSKKPNFEKTARDERKNFFQTCLKKGDVIFTAHHLNDSFEWSLMQQFKSSNIKSSLGIPVCNGYYKRPFLCVSRKHISKLVEKENIPYREDPSNNDTRFERNYIRKCVVKNIESRYPKYLKHYVHKQNEMAHDLGLRKKNENEQLNVYRSFCESLILHPRLSDDFGQGQSLLREEIHRLSHDNRGKINSQIEKLLLSKRSHKKGPLSFSGGVKAYMETGLIYLTSRKDEETSILISKSKSKIQFNDCYNSTPALFYTDEPSELEKKLPGLGRGDGLYKDVKNALIDQGLYVQSLTKLFKVFGRERELTGCLYRPKSFL
jgi:tRNA(Ile)-lysidine synthase